MRSWWGADGQEYKFSRVPMDDDYTLTVTEDSGVYAEYVPWNDQILLHDPGSVLEDKIHAYSADTTRAMGGYAVGDATLSFSYDLHESNHFTWSMEITSEVYDPKPSVLGEVDCLTRTYLMSFDQTTIEESYIFPYAHIRPAVHGVLGPPGLVWIVRPAYTKRVSTRVIHREYSFVKNWAMLSPTEGYYPDPYPQTIGYYDPPDSETDVTTDVDTEYAAEGWVINGRVATAMSEADVDTLCTLINTMAGPTTYTSTNGLTCYPAYYGRVNIFGLALSAGLDAAGAALAGRWIGSG